MDVDGHFKSILILDVPTTAYVPSLIASFADSPFFSPYRSKDEATRRQHPLFAVYHLCGPGVIEDERYKSFMSGFSDETYVSAESVTKIMSY